MTKRNIKRRYLIYIEKDSDKLSLKWKALHILIFTLIVVNAFCTAYAFHYIFDSFNYHCILYLNPIFEIKDIQYNKTKTDSLPGNDTTAETSSLNNTAIEVPHLNDSIFEVPYYKDPLEYDPDEHVPDTVLIPGLSFKVPNVAGVEVRNGRFWINNETLTGQVTVDLRRTVFTDVHMCNWALFCPLSAILVAVFLCVLVITFERGGAGYRTDVLRYPWTNVLPCLIASAVMVLFYIVISATVRNGLNMFCLQFQQFTGHQICTKLMDFFTIQRRFGKGNFYLMAKICSYSFPIGLVLWILQLVLNICRILFVADFQLKTVTIRSKHVTQELDEEEIHKALLNSYPKLGRALVIAQGPRRKSIGHTVTELKMTTEDKPAEKKEETEETKGKRKTVQITTPV